MVYSTVQGQARVGNLLLSCGYGQIFSVTATAAINQGAKLYMTDAVGTTAQTIDDVESGHTFAGYALPKDVDAAATEELLPAAGTGDILVWFRPE